MLSKRLSAVARLVKNCDLVADIGTDHGYIPIYLATNSIIHRAIAADISKGSCDKARYNITSNRLDNIISVRCGNGIEVINKDEKVDCIIIAGMGGLLLIEVLKSNTRAVNQATQIVLQPQRDIEKVRRYIHSIGFKIENEKMLIDNNKYYNIISAVKGEEVYTDLEYRFGKILITEKSNILKEYAHFELNKILNVISYMLNNGQEDSMRYYEILKDKKLYEEVILCL